MKIKTELLGVFYKDGNNWRGPIDGDLFTIEEIGGADVVNLFLQEYAKRRKKQVKLFRQVWKSE
jgi:hypothetical protein